MWPYHGTWVEIRGWPHLSIFAFLLRISFCLCLIACLFSADYVKLGYPWTSEKSPLWAFTQRVIQLTPPKKARREGDFTLPWTFWQRKAKLQDGKALVRKQETENWIDLAFTGQKSPGLWVFADTDGLTLFRTRKLVVMTLKPRNWIHTGTRCVGCTSLFQWFSLAGCSQLEPACLLCWPKCLACLCLPSCFSS